MNRHSKANSKLERFYKDLLLNNPEFFEGLLKPKPRSHSPKKKKSIEYNDKSTAKGKKITQLGSKTKLNKQQSTTSLSPSYNDNKVNSPQSTSSIRIKKKKIKTSSTEKDFRIKFQLLLNSPLANADNHCFNKKGRSLSNDRKHYNVFDKDKNTDKGKGKSKQQQYQHCSPINQHNSLSPIRFHSDHSKSKIKLSIDCNYNVPYGKKRIEIKTTTNNIIKKNKIKIANTNSSSKKREDYNTIGNGNTSPLIWKSIHNKMNNNNIQRVNKNKVNDISKDYAKKEVKQIKNNSAIISKTDKPKPRSRDAISQGKKNDSKHPNDLELPQANINVNANHPKSKSPINKAIFKIDILSTPGYGGPNDIKVNQDNYFIFKHLNDELNTYFIGVCDGHGTSGQDISKYIITHLPKQVHSELKQTNKYISNKETRNKAITSAFLKINDQLCHTQLIDTKYSGSTCTAIILKKNKIMSANTGDSRAVLGRFIPQSNSWVAIDLTRDHKPSDVEESERIIRHGGRIESYRDEYGKPFGPPRIWLKDQELPGLAMTRSFGDKVASYVGTITEPEIKEFNLTKEDKFVIVASDGIWEYINSSDCVNIVKDYYATNDVKGCLSYLWNEASKRWINEEERIDDITCILIFFENND